MRIIAGEFSSRKLFAPKSLQTRPSLDRVRESVFNILGQYFNGGDVLDLFCGSGINGFEFLSRGADFIYFVDRARDSKEAVLRNSEILKIHDKIKFIKSDYKKALNSFASNSFQYIYMDPPFANEDYYLKSFKIISERKLLKSNGKLIIEHDSDMKIFREGLFSEMQSKKYGKVTISIWEDKWR